MGIRFRSIRTSGLLVATCAAGLLTASCTGANNGERSTSTSENEGFVTAVEGSADQEEVSEAIRYLTEGSAQGKLVVTVSQNADPAATRAERTAELEHK